jgi:hypothetical protein
MSPEKRVGVAIGLIVLSGAASLTSAQSTAALPNPYQVVEKFFTLPDGRMVGSTPAVDIDPDGKSIWVFERCGGASGGGTRPEPPP